MEKIAIFGAGGFGREVKMLIDQINLQKETFEIIGYFDDGKPKDSLINSYPVLGGLTDVQNWKNGKLNLVIAIAQPNIKKRIADSIKNVDIAFPSLIHPGVLIGTDEVTIGYGCIICAGTIITVNITIGNHVILNLGCTVGHDAKIGDYCSFMPSVDISGEVEIDSLVFVGSGAKIINQLSIGERTIVGSGAVVSKSLPANCTAVGVPAKPIKFHE